MKKICSILLLVIFVLNLCACSQEHPVSLKEEDIRAICELATLECYYNNVAKIEKKADTIFQTDRKMWIEYEGKATIGINMTNVVISLSGTTVTIKMPQAEILSIDYTFNENSSISSSDGWLFKNEISTQEQQDAVIASQDAMTQAILDNRSLFMKAEARAKELIENYITELGEATNQEYTVVWQK